MMMLFEISDPKTFGCCRLHGCRNEGEPVQPLWNVRVLIYGEGACLYSSILRFTEGRRKMLYVELSLSTWAAISGQVVAIKSAAIARRKVEHAFNIYCLYIRLPRLQGFCFSIRNSGCGATRAWKDHAEKSGGCTGDTFGCDGQRPSHRQEYSRRRSGGNPISLYESGRRRSCSVKPKASRCCHRRTNR